MIHRSAIKGVVLSLIASLLLASMGCGSSDDGDDIAQAFACMTFPLFCFIPIHKANSSMPIEYAGVDELSQRVELVRTAMDGRENTYGIGSIVGYMNAVGEDGGRDAIVVKYDPSGNVAWTRLFGSIDDERAEDLSVGTDGSVLVTIVKKHLIGEDSGNIVKEQFVLRLSDEGVLLGIWAKEN